MANNKITLGKLRTLDSKTYTQKKIKAGNYDVLVDEQFRPSKINDMVLEYTQKLDYCREKGYDLKSGEYIFILMIRYFTDIDIPEDFESQVQMLKIMVDHDLLTPILNSFNEKEVEKMNDKINEFKDNVNKLVAEMKIEQESENKEVGSK